MTELSHRSSIRPDIPSEPVALLGLKLRIRAAISLSPIVRWSILCQ